MILCYQRDQNVSFVIHRSTVQVPAATLKTKNICTRPHDRPPQRMLSFNTLSIKETANAKKTTEDGTDYIASEMALV